MADTDVTITPGTLRGEHSTSSGVRRFLGVPYAESTAGEHRWRPPRPVRSWDGIRDATAFAPASWQMPVSRDSLYYGGEDTFSEDCLTLNIWTGPEGDTGRPVMVWLHLGAFQFGSPTHPLYDGDRLAARGVTVVSVTYRLGRLGFLAHPDLSAESGTGGSGNYGLMDQIEALRFVQQNIARFGGDPHNVTLVGVSAGADSVHKLRCSPRAVGLFHRAIAHSGPGVAPAIDGPGNPGYTSTLAAGEAAGIELLTALGAGSIAEARLLPPEVIVGARLARAAGPWTSPTAPDAGLSVHRYDSGYPVVDGDVLVEPPETSFRAGRIADVPALVGSVTNEQSGGRRLDTLELYTAYLAETFGDLADEALELYPASTDLEAQAASRALIGDEVFITSSWNAARFASRSSASPVWHFRFLREPPLAGEVPEKADGGSFHGADILYLFGTFADRDGDWTEEDRALSDRLQRAWISFARTGDPTSGGAIEWPPFDAAAPLSKLWDLVDRVADLSDPRRTRFWDAYRASATFVH